MAEGAFVVDPVEWQKAFRSWAGPVGKFVKRKTFEVHVAARREVPAPAHPPRNRTGVNYATGRLAVEHVQGFSREGARQDLEGQVIALPDYAKYLFHGTKPHVIVPKTPGGKLVFFWPKKGRIVAFPKVDHPGTAANQWLVRAIERVGV